MSSATLGCLRDLPRTLRFTCDNQRVLLAAGAELEHVVKWTIYLVQGQPLQPGLQAFQRAWGNRPNPPTISMMYVAGLANPDYLLEMDAIAVVPE